MLAIGHNRLPALPAPVAAVSLEDISTALTVTSAWALTLSAALLRVVSGQRVPPRGAEVPPRGAEVPPTS